ncbi:MAG: chorismate synthase [Muribaculaceae bacterium]|nr:chorismate synthase [Muribaculaceae bacterium]
MNSLGTLLRLTTFGESHGAAMGGILDGLPAGTRIDMEEVQKMIDRRRTGVDPLTSQRRETDIPEVLSGISEDGVTLGTPIGFIFRNSDARSRDYGDLADHYRPNHADFTYDLKYNIRDYRGGGRASARETVNWVMGGALSAQWLSTLGISVEARLTQAGAAGYSDPFRLMRETPEISRFQTDPLIESAMRDEIEWVRKDCDSVGGRVSCVIRGLPAGIGNPVFDKLQARLASAMMSINAAKGFEYGLGALSSEKRGSEILDHFNVNFNPLPFNTNFSGGILGGISTGMPVYFNVWFKPTPTISRPLPMADKNGQLKNVKVEGRHDPCVAMRAPVIVESLALLTVGDMILGNSGFIRL